jgi:RNA polymerase sigma-70 factor (ECF subfamily)
MPDWPQIVEREGPLVWRTVYRLLGNRADAEECFQETFLSAINFARRQTIENWPALLRRLATARAIDRLRQRMRRGHDPAVLDELPGASAAPSESLQLAELSDRLRIAISRLAPKQAEVFTLHCIEGWSYQAIAEATSSTTDAVGVLLFRARAKLRELLGSAIDGEQPSEPAPAAEPQHVAAAATIGRRG